MFKSTRHLILIIVLISTFALAQTGYQPKFKGDPAHSDAEAAALGYMRTVVIAQRLYKRKHAAYATSLAALIGSGSFTRRMINTERGDYTAQFRSTGNNFSLAMTPKQYDDAHRAFFVDDIGTLRTEPDKPATASSPPLKASKE
jgi:hypothetical protein